MNRRSFIQFVSAAVGLFSIRRSWAFGASQEKCEADDRELEAYVNRIVDGNVVPILSNSQADRSSEDGQRYVGTGVCRELYDLQPDLSFHISYPLSYPWGRAPHFEEQLLFGDTGELFIKRPCGIPWVRKEVLKPRGATKSAKISAQELLALDDDPVYLYGYGRGLDDPQEAALREQETY